ncbi:MAG: DUF4388 domain-containing protein [Candidatus Zixiibacteriota bacterium]
MNPTLPHKRLDEILLEMGLINDEKIKKALDCQKLFGGRFGSQLLTQNLISETDLVKALSVQLGCKGVILSKIEIHDIIIKMIPIKIAISRKVIPFDYDPENNLLKIACIDPHQPDIINEMKFLSRGKNIELFVSAEAVLNTYIARHYLKMDIKGLLHDIPEIPPDLFSEEGGKEGDNRLILMVTDEQSTLESLRQVFENDGYRVVNTDSADNAIDLLERKNFYAVFIKDTVTGDYIDLIERVRKKAPKTLVNYYENSSALLLNQDIVKSEIELHLTSLEIFTSILSSKSNFETDHSGMVGKYADKLCKKMDIPDRDRLMISTAGYIHDLAIHYYNTNPSDNPRQTISLTTKLLSSLNYSPIITEMLRTMYLDLKGKYTKRLPIEVLGGNILTLVDLFCENFPKNDCLSLDKFETIKKKMKDLTGKLFLKEVVDAFIEMIQDSILDNHDDAHEMNLMIFAEEVAMQERLEQQLGHEGFRLIIHDSREKFIEMYRRSKPSMIIISAPGTPDSVIELVDNFEAEGIIFSDIPTFILTEAICVPRLTQLIEQGVEDIIPFDDTLNLLASKSRRMKFRMDSKTGNETSDSDIISAQGRLLEMNLIDLLQAMGPGRKTVKITIHANNSEQQNLIIYLKQGVIHHATLNDLAGAEAIYEGLGWIEGTWKIEPVKLEELPLPNNDQPNESILMEGCRLLDERSRTEQSV